MTPRKPPTTVSDLTRQQQTGDLITHIGKQDPHLYQALTSMQKQSNQLVQNIEDLAAAINNLADSINNAIFAITKKTTIRVHHPALPGSGGLRGQPADSGGSGENTAPIPPPVKRR